MMFFPPNPLKEGNSNKAKESPKGFGPLSIGEIYQLFFASLLGTVVWMFLGKWVSASNAFIAGLVTTIGFYLLFKKVKLPTKND